MYNSVDFEFKVEARHTKPGPGTSNYLHVALPELKPPNILLAELSAPSKNT